MAAARGVPPEEYATFMPGTKLPDARGGARSASRRKTGWSSLYGSRKVADDFNVANKVYADAAAGRRVHRRLAADQEAL